MKTNIQHSLRLMADMIDAGHPADLVSVHSGGVTVIVSNPITQQRWRAALHRGCVEADVRLVQRIGDVA